MSKIVLDDVASGYNLSKINANFDEVATEFQDKVLYRDNPSGEPNQMENELDMNSNSIVNVGVVYASSLVLGGETVVPGDVQAVDPAYPVQSGNANKVLTTDGTSVFWSSKVPDLAVQNDSTKGAVGVGFYDGLAPAYLKTVSDILNGLEVSVFRFLSPAQKAAVIARSLATDLTADLTVAHATGVPIYYPYGSYSFDTLSFSAGGIRGAGRGQSRLISSNSSTNHLITYTGTSGSTGVATFRDFHIEATNTKAAGAGLKFTPPSDELQYSLIDGISVYNTPRSIQLDEFTYGQLSNNILLNYTDAGIYYSNHFNYGAGDVLIANNHIGTGQASGNRFGLYQESGGGLRFIGNKVLGGGSGFVLGYTGTIGSGPLIINSNSIENCINSAIYLGNTGSADFGGIIIDGNEIAICGSGILSDAGGRIINLNIGSNYIELASGAGYGIQLNNVDDFNIGSQTIVGGGGTPTGIDITSTCTNGRVGVQTYKNLTTKVVNASSTTFLQTLQQSGTSTVTTSTVYGSMYIGATSVTFATPFALAPKVNCFASSVNGGVSAFASSVTTTGFTFNVIGLNNGGAVSGCIWNAEGVL